MGIRDWLTLSLTRGIGPILARRIVDTAGTAQRAAVADAAVLRQVEGIGIAGGLKIAAALRKAATEVDAELARARAAGAQLICPDDDQYPLQLRTIPDPPMVLYLRGELQPRDLHAVAIVGSRKCSLYGREQADRFGALLAGAGVTVLSGGARGIDSAAHRGAMSHPQGRTLAVLGSGVDVVYPPENRDLFDQIARQGAVISEYPMGTPPLAENFPKRNRIVSGMSRGVLVIEADERSGALITARQAGVDQGRPVFALPGRVDNSLSIGPHQLIRDGATLVTNLQDILDDLGPLPDEADVFDPVDSSDAEPAEPPPPLFAAATTAVTDAVLNETQKVILAAIDAAGSGVDDLVDATGLDVSVILRDLTFLTLKARVKRLDGQRYQRV